MRTRLSYSPSIPKEGGREGGKGREGGREGGREAEGGRQGGREEEGGECERQGGREGGRGGREGGREGGRGGREGGREGGRGTGRQGGRDAEREGGTRAKPGNRLMKDNILFGRYFSLRTKPECAVTCYTSHNVSINHAHSVLRDARRLSAIPRNPAENRRRDVDDD